MLYQQFQRKCLLDLFKPIQCTKEIEHQMLSDLKYIIHNQITVSNSYALIQKEFTGIESIYDLDRRQLNNYMYQEFVKHF